MSARSEQQNPQVIPLFDLRRSYRDGYRTVTGRDLPKQARLHAPEGISRFVAYPDEAIFLRVNGVPVPRAQQLSDASNAQNPRLPQRQRDQ